MRIDVAGLLAPVAQRLHDLSIARWGDQRAVHLVGHSAPMLALQAKLEKFARYQEPVLVVGESGAGKEHIAQAIYLLSRAAAAGAPYVSVNCPQFQDGTVTVSELFGHTRGSFTGAVGDRRGAFEEADGGVIFLDEIGDLPPPAQAMLLRTLATGEFKALGSDRPRVANVRVVSATNRPLNQLMLEEKFRADLFFRLRYFQIDVPPLRDRGDDWRLLIDYCLRRLAVRYGERKTCSKAAWRLLEGYDWPGNVRQLVGVVNTAYAMADGDVIEPQDFEGRLAAAAETGSSIDDLYERIVAGQADFWADVHQPFLERDLNRSQVRALVRRAFDAAHWNYRRLLEVLRLPTDDYQRFMDFLRHHRLKPGHDERPD
ncbi:MAG: sigma 54-interacting transcriptional regulator [Vicinamibacterales bacterium]